MWKIIGENFKNAQYIFPTKQKDVADMINCCKPDDNIKKIIVFGSSVTAACNPWSDVDIYFEMAEERNNLPTYKSNTAVFDKWTNFSVSAELLQEIQNKGVLVYER